MPTRRGGPGAAPDTDPDASAYIAWQLRDQARSCRTMGSPLYAALLERAAEDAAAGGPVWQLLRGHASPGRGHAIALRFLAAVHRLVLRGEAPQLAPCYPSVGGVSDPDRAAAALVPLVEERRAVLDDLVALPCQTNEVGRCAGLIVGFLWTAAVAARPVRMLEVGASAGLNLRWDHYRYGGGGSAWGPPDSPVDLHGLWAEPPPHVGVSVRVLERRGCDPHPVDPTSEEGRLALTASVWPDQVDRFRRLRGALQVADRVPAQVDRASADEWLPDRLRTGRTGVATIVFHSIVEEYLTSQVRRRFHDALHLAGAAATKDAPLAWVRLEPVTAVRRHGVSVTLWPPGDTRMLATCGAHGQDVRIDPSIRQ